MAICSFIGLGVMGYPMAGHLATHGYQTRVYNRTLARAEDWQQKYGGTAYKTPKEAAEGADFVMVCVGNDDDVRSVVFGEDGALSGMKPGSILVDHTTTSAELAKEIAVRAGDAKVGFLDAPVSGGEIGAVNGQLTIMVGGQEDDFARAEKALQVYAKSVRRMGGAGAGQLTKMVNQICIAGLLQGLSEGLHFAERVGLDIEAVVEVISKGAAQSWQMENRYKTMKANKFDFGFAVDWMRKDLSICLAEAERNNAPLPITKIVDEFYADVQKLGGNRWDTSSLIARLRALQDA